MAWFFEEIFLLADICLKVVLEILFMTFNNAVILFLEQELIWGSYTIVETLPITKQVELIDKKEFTKTVFNKNFEVFIIHMATFSLASRPIYPDWEAQIAFLIA